MACAKGKQHKKSHKSKAVNSISVPFQLLHMDLFGPVSVKSISRNSYCLVVTDDFSRYSWVNFLATKDEIVEVLKSLILKIDKICKRLVFSIRSDNGSEFKNHVLNEFCESKGISRQFSAARTPQQNGAEAVNTANYVLNRALVVKAHNKTAYELFHGRKPLIEFFRAFGCSCTLLNTAENLAKFGAVGDEYIIFNNFIPPAPLIREPSPSTEISLIPSIQAEDEFLLFSTRLTPATADPMSVSSTVTSSHSEAAEIVSINTSDENLTNLPAQVEVDDGPSFKTLSNHPLENVIGPITEGVRTRSYSTPYNTTLL
ncbi:hypothetical protein L1987_20282 [Smallanthus sonchifolius]|uniref:Uncharacterized protein n=1 Tax=Smallanthus sonchifolius TaxID=185202 RepID=A0ACB9IRM0_9ASTR|nr:hypothetical protein L1987_20282 [Smallanthus sonchifolius]